MVDKVLPRAKRRLFIDDSIKGVLPLLGNAPTGGK
jgi:hypothetical protein